MTKTNWMSEICALCMRVAMGLAAVVLTATLCAAQAQEKVAKPDFRRLEIIIPYSAGGGTDILVRRLVEELRPKLDVPIAVRNVRGDAAMLGLSRVAKSSPDEAILGFHNPPNTVLAQLARGDNAPIDIRKLTPIAGYSKTCSVVATYKDSPYNTFKQLAEAYASNKERLIGGTDRGGSSELACEILKSDFNLQWKEYVAYDGSGDLNAATARREIPAGVGSYDSVLDGMKSGALKPLLVLGMKDRLPEMPDTPTAIEVGPRSLSEVAAPIRVIVGPPNMEPGLRAYFVQIWREILTDPVVIEKFQKTGVQLQYISPEEVDEAIKGAFSSLENLPALKKLQNRK